MAKIDINKLKSLTKEEKLALYDKIQKKKEYKRNNRAAFKPNDAQLPVTLDDHKIRFFAGGNGCWAPGTLIRMYDGSTKKVEEIELGDLLIGPDSQPREVLKLYSGIEEMFRVIPKWSDTYIVNASHMLSIFRWRKARFGKSVSKYEEIKVSDWIQLGREARRTSYQWKPAEGVQYKKADLPIDPYIFGTWLGDGNSANLAITSMDEVIVNEWKRYYSNLKCRKVQQKNNKASTYNFSTGSKGNLNPGWEPYKRLGVANNKHIPNIYFKSSREQRLELLAGLIDTDGHLAENVAYEIIQVRQSLCDDIKELCNSLGFYTKKTVKIIKGKPYYRLYIHGRIERVPVKLKHKQRDMSQNIQRANEKEPFKIESIGLGKFYGFQVDCDNLLLLADYTVQRNSGKTTLLTNEHIWFAEGYNPIKESYTKVPSSIAVVVDAPIKIKDTHLKELAKWYNMDKLELLKNGKPYVNEIVWPNGSRSVYYTHDQDPMIFESTEYDYILIDEPCPEHIFIGLSRGQRTKHANPKTFIVGTPLAQTWLRTKIWEPWENGENKDIACFRGRTEQNRQNLADNYIESFTRLLSEDEKRVRLEGEFWDIGGLALAHVFKKAIHVVDPKPIAEDEVAIVAIDPHPSKKHVAICLVISLKTGYKRVKFEHASKMLAKDFAVALYEICRRELGGTHRVVDWICDSLGAAEMTGGDGFKSFIQVLNEHGIKCRSTTFEEKDQEDWIERIKNELAIPMEADNFGKFVPNLTIENLCYNTIKDIENVAWLKVRNTNINKPILDIAQKDFLACLKYALAAAAGITASEKKNRSPDRGRVKLGSGSGKFGIRQRYFNRNGS